VNHSDTQEVRPPGAAVPARARAVIACCNHFLPRRSKCRQPSRREDETPWRPAACARLAVAALGWAAPGRGRAARGSRVNFRDASAGPRARCAGPCPRCARCAQQASQRAPNARVGTVARAGGGGYQSALCPGHAARPALLSMAAPDTDGCVLVCLWRPRPRPCSRRCPVPPVPITSYTVPGGCCPPLSPLPHARRLPPLSARGARCKPSFGHCMQAARLRDAEPTRG